MSKARRRRVDQLDAGISATQTEILNDLDDFEHSGEGDLGVKIMGRKGKKSPKHHNQKSKAESTRGSSSKAESTGEGSSETREEKCWQAVNPQVEEQWDEETLATSEAVDFTEHITQTTSSLELGAMEPFQALSREDYSNAVQEESSKEPTTTNCTTERSSRMSISKSELNINAKEFHPLNKPSQTFKNRHSHDDDSTLHESSSNNEAERRERRNKDSNFSSNTSTWKRSSGDHSRRYDPPHQNDWREAKRKSQGGNKNSSSYRGNNRSFSGNDNFFKGNNSPYSKPFMKDRYDEKLYSKKNVDDTRAHGKADYKGKGHYNKNHHPYYSQKHDEATSWDPVDKQSNRPDTTSSPLQSKDVDSYDPPQLSSEESWNDTSLVSGISTGAAVDENWDALTEENAAPTSSLSNQYINELEVPSTVTDDWETETLPNESTIEHNNPDDSRGSRQSSSDSHLSNQREGCEKMNKSYPLERNRDSNRPNKLTRYSDVDRSKNYKRTVNRSGDRNRGEECEDFFHSYDKYARLDDGLVKEIEKDLFRMGKEYSLAHCVAADLRMGSGIAVEFKREFKKVDELLDQRQRQGGLAFLDVSQGADTKRFIYYLVTKRDSSGKPTYQTFWSSLKKMRDHIKAHEVKKLAIPRLGCGLDRLEWHTVKAMLEYLFKDVDVEIIVCNFQQNYGQTKQQLPSTVIKEIPSRHDKKENKRSIKTNSKNTKTNKKNKNKK